MIGLRFIFFAFDTFYVRFMFLVSVLYFTLFS